MDIPVRSPALHHGMVAIRHSLWLGSKVLYQGSVVKPVKRVYTVPGTDGRPVALQLRRNFPDLIPLVIVNGTVTRIVSPLPWYVWLWIGAPLLLMFAGGALGAVFGGAAAFSSAALFRSPNSTAAKWVLSGLYSAGAIIAFLASAVLLQGLIRR